jgi:hypothetical protein
MINAPFLVVYVLLTAPPFDEMKGVRGKTEMTQPHGFPGGCIAYKPTILLLYSRSLCRNVNKYFGLMLLNPLFIFLLS